CAMSICVCPSCGNEAQILEAFRGKTVQCPHCAASFVTPEKQPPDGTSPVKGLLVVACPSCRRPSCVTAEQKGKDVQCPHCGRRFPALAENKVNRPAPRESSPITFPRSTQPSA